MFDKVKQFLQPLVLALCGFLTAATVAMNEGRDSNADLVHTQLDNRITILEGNVSELKALREEIRVLNNNITIILTKMELLHGK